VSAWVSENEKRESEKRESERGKEGREESGERTEARPMSLRLYAEEDLGVVTKETVGLNKGGSATTLCLLCTRKRGTDRKTCEHTYAQGQEKRESGEGEGV